MILLVFGWLLIGCAFILVGWVPETGRHASPLSRFNAPFLMAVFMDLHALGFILTFGGRIGQILFDGASFDTESPIYWAGTAMILAAKTGFIWVASLGEGRKWSKPLMFSYFACLLAWAGFTGWWYS